MKRSSLLLTLIVLLFVSVKSNAQVDTAWTHLWDSQYWDEAHAITTDELNNIYIAGWNYEWGVNYDFIFAKYDATGNLQWSKVRNYSSGDQASHILYDHQGNIYIGGFVNGVYSTTGGSFCLMKYTVNGDSIWEFVDNNTYVAQVSSMKFDNQGNIILAGYDGSFSSDYVTMKIDTAGNQLWYKTYSNSGPNDVDKIWDMCVDADGYIYVTGISDDTVNFYQDIATIKYNPDGDTVWVRRFNGPTNYFDFGRKVLVDQDKNVFVGGTIQKQTPASSDIVLIKYDSKGNLIWKTYYDYQPAPQSFDNIVDMKMDNAGNIYMTGTSSSNNSQATTRILTVKFNTNGDTLWTKRWGNAGDKAPKQLMIDNMANIYITGSYYDNNGTGYNAVTLRYDSSGVLDWEAIYNDGTNQEESFYTCTLDGNNDLIAAGRTHSPTTFDCLTVKYQNALTAFPLIENGYTQLHIDCYPNPFTGSATIRYNLPASSEATLKVFNLLGKEVRVLADGRLQAGNHSMPFNADGLKAGIYFLRLTNNENQVTRKIIVR
jgi:uncharacterized delta-60 repeat protein